MKLTVRAFERQYLLRSDMKHYRGSLRALRIGKSSPYLWSLVEQDGKLWIVSGYVKGAIDYVSASLPRKL